MGAGMAEHGRIRRNASRRSITCGTAEQGLPGATQTGAPARVVSMRGTRWLVTVVARLLSEDVATGVEAGRLVLRLECMTHPGRPARIATIRARSLDELDDDALHAIVSARLNGRGMPKVREGQGVIRRTE